jgi:hypothetical protein
MDFLIEDHGLVLIRLNDIKYIRGHSGKWYIANDSFNEITRESAIKLLNNCVNNPYAGDISPKSYICDNIRGDYRLDFFIPLLDFEEDLIKTHDDKYKFDAFIRKNHWNAEYYDETEEPEEILEKSKDIDWDAIFNEDVEEVKDDEIDWDTMF